MNRRTWLGAAAASLPLSGVAALAAEKEEAEGCCLDCNDCQTTCLACVRECLEEGKADRAACIKACLDCADICEACSKIGARGGPMAKIIAQACAESCEKCAAECERHDDETCKACAKKCRECAKQCREKAGK